jgi:hypothetical protein
VSPVAVPLKAATNPRHAAAIRFAATSGRRSPGDLKGFLRALDSYLWLHDFTHPESRCFEINRKQCIAIYFSADRRTARKRAS